MSADETIERISSFINQAECLVCGPLEQMADRFPTAKQLVDSVRGAHKRLKSINSVEDSQFSNALNALRNYHNEACVAFELLKQGADRLDYEWQESAGSRCIDFLVQQGDTRRWVEVKTIHPDNIDSWDSFERVRSQNLITERVKLHLDRDGLGGEIWHHKFAARSKMLDYSIDTEVKITSLGIDASCDTVELWFCGNGFRWRIDELEDFVAFYLTGHHRPDDPFAKMETHHLNKKGITLLRAIKRFGYLERPDPSISPIGLSIPVLPPAFPW